VRINVSMAASASPQGAYHWPSDPETTWARSLGLHVDAVLGWTPTWANTNGRLDPTKFAAFAKAAATHLASLGVHTYEIGSAPNTGAWVGGVSPANYAAVLKAAYRAIHAGDPGATVVIGGLRATSTTARAIAPSTFLSDLYAAGAQGFFDAVGTQPLSRFVATQPSPANPWPQMPALHQLMVAHGDGAKKVWITGYGAAASSATTDANQSVYLSQAYHQAASWSWTGPFIVFEWQDTPDYWGSYGLTTTSGVAKPALTTMAELATGA
jgi:hypothetical protein